VKRGGMRRGHTPGTSGRHRGFAADATAGWCPIHNGLLLSGGVGNGAFGVIGSSFGAATGAEGAMPDQIAASA